MRSLHKKILILIAMLWAVCAVVFMGAYFLVLAPQATIKADLSRRLAEKKLIYDQAVKAAQDDTKAQIAAEMLNLRNQLGAYVADQNGVANLTFAISKIASDKRLNSFTIKTRENREVPNCSLVGENQIYVSFVGGFNQFAAFLNELERHQPVIFIDKFTITRSDKDTASHVINMDLSVFVRKQSDERNS